MLDSLPATRRPGSFPNLAIQAWHYDRLLTVFALTLAALMLPALVALWVDTREVRGVNTWVKPLKFLSSLALFSFCTALFQGLLTPDERSDRSIRIMRALIIATGGFEIAYISFQAALGQPSHFNFSDTAHKLLYNFMGVAALILTSTQLILARKISKSKSSAGPMVLRKAVTVGLVLTFALGAGSGMVLGGMQPPTGSGLPFLGWHLGGGDLRVAHFLGMHAQQLLPMIGIALLAAGAAQKKGVQILSALAALYTLIWLLAMARGISLI